MENFLGEILLPKAFVSRWLLSALDPDNPHLQLFLSRVVCHTHTDTHRHTHTDTSYEALYQCPARPDVTHYNGSAKGLDGDGDGDGNISSPVEEIETQEV